MVTRTRTWWRSSTIRSLLVAAVAVAVLALERAGAITLSAEVVTGLGVLLLAALGWAARGRARAEGPLALRRSDDELDECGGAGCGCDGSDED